LYPAFYNKKELKDAINACVKKVTKIRILLDKNANINTLDLLRNNLEKPGERIPVKRSNMRGAMDALEGSIS
jgi:hypothetical protein